MAGTVVSMARSMLGGAISMAASAPATEMSLLMGVRKDIWFIKDELKTMQAFLVAADKTKNKDLLLKPETTLARKAYESTDSLMKCLKDLEGKQVQIQNLSEYVTKELVDKRYFVVPDDL
ncbi:hypothetical protein ZWY2020_047763 [Hordeum vulgare]|nr:hypothetical protein ZWY2020_047763 [Hordeum vulgare]